MACFRLLHDDDDDDDDFAQILYRVYTRDTRSAVKVQGQEVEITA